MTELRAHPLGGEGGDDHDGPGKVDCHDDWSHVSARFGDGGVRPVLATLMLALTAVVPHWIDVLFRIEPDASAGERECLIGGGVAAIVLVSRREFHCAVGS
jgi:hypothetical protein